MKAIKLFFKTPIRAGIPGIGLEGASSVFPSPTLFGALATALGECGEDVQGFVELAKEGKLEISSCFPFVEDRLLVCQPSFPCSSNKLIELKNLENFKPYPEKVWDEEEFLLDIPKVGIDRRTGNSTIYYISAAFVKDGGFYFLLRGDSKLIEIALRYLKEEGLGGKKSWGMGAISEFKIEKVKLRTTGEVYMTLSQCIPERKDSLLFWKPFTRGGWSYKGIAKPKLTYALEGSVFREMDGGRMIEIEDEIYSYAKSFLIPIMLEGENEA